MSIGGESSRSRRDRGQRKKIIVRERPAKYRAFAGKDERNKEKGFGESRERLRRQKNR